MKRATTFLSLLALSAGLLAQSSVKTERQYLSGRGCDDMVQWDFMCTGGNNSGKWTKIGVPSCWELQGFGTYQYGRSMAVTRTPLPCLLVRITSVTSS
jgi:hypothetical protein